MMSPVPYSPTVETRVEDEQQVIADLAATLTDIIDTVAADEGHAVRSVHAKSHGLIEAELDVLPDLPVELAQGLFATPGTHPALIRISTNPGDILDDSVSVPRGLALKVLDVDGPRLAGAEGTTQDFVLVNGPVFAAPDPAAFLKTLKLLEKTTDRAQWAKKALSAVLRGTNAALGTIGVESATLVTLGGQPAVHPLGDTYFSQTPYRYGDYIAKFQMVPVSDSLTELTDAGVTLRGRPDALREEIHSAMRSNPAVWELRVQLCRDLEAMPIEDATVLWSEDDSPFVTVARITAAAQTGWSEARAKIVDETMRFSPWTGLAAHQPLGAVNRSRKESYDASARHRAGINGCPFHEPRDLDLPA